MASKKNVNSVEEYLNTQNDLLYGIKLNKEQVIFRNEILNDNKLIIFCNSKSGTGKTLVAVATGVLLCECNKYSGIVYVTAPTQEQKQGYLSGTIEEKSEPYFEPLYQALDTIGINKNTSLSSNIINQKNGTSFIECVTHTFLRGTNFENKVIIIDESQNFYVDELKKVLTRTHDNCKVIVIGHTGQIDIYNHPERSGFSKYLEHFRGDDRTSICELTINCRGWISSHADNLVI